jgi:hypothetical protein
MGVGFKTMRRNKFCFQVLVQKHKTTLCLYDQLINIFSFISNEGKGWDVPFRHFLGLFEAFC